MADIQREEPFIASTPPQTESVTTIPCAICKRQFSRYTCPRCNAPYCSLVCFRAAAHADCSEPFYRDELAREAQSAPADERRRMLDLLKRFEEDGLGDSPLLGEDVDADDDDVDDLVERLGGIDVEAASHDELWSRLTPAERDKFSRALNDPSSELAQHLLASEELESVQVEPWWVASPDATPGPSVPHPRTLRRRGVRPEIIDLPEPLVKRSSDAAATRPLLLYNICAVCIAYAYVVRHFAASPLSSLSPDEPDCAEARRVVSQLVPFLAERRSTTVLKSISGTVTDLWSRFPPHTVDSQLFSLLLQDMAILLRPATVTVHDPVIAENDPREHANANTLRVLSDLAALFGSRSAAHPEGKPVAAKTSHVVHKLNFYSAYVLGTPAALVHAVMDETVIQVEIMKGERQRRSEDDALTGAGRAKPQSSGIQELS